MKRVLAPCGSPGHWDRDASEPYEEALRAAGMEPVLITPASFGSTPGAVFDGMAGLLLMGGSDVNPRLYGEPRHEKTQPSDDARDAMEFALIEDAIARDLPVFAICRGIQILNVQHGGSLVQHLEGCERHVRRTGDRALPAHPVEVVPGTLLAAIEGDAVKLNVNSRHHQAVGRLGTGLKVSAVDPEDATIEAVERPDRRFVVGVQWHPENQFATDTGQAKLFEAFAGAI